MKKLTVFIFLIMSMFILSTTASANESDYEWDNNGDGTATITGYTGTDNDLVIPNKLNGLTVTTIGEYAFDHQTKGVQLTSVVIPDSVTTIEKYAFYYNSLTKLIIPDSVTSIGEAAFYQNSLVEVTLSENITALGEYAFGSDRKSTRLNSSHVAISYAVF